MATSLKQQLEEKRKRLQTTKKEIEEQLQTVDKVIKLLNNHPEIEEFDKLMQTVEEEKE